MQCSICKKTSPDTYRPVGTKYAEHVLVRSNLLLMRRAKTVPKLAKPGRGWAIKEKYFSPRKTFSP